MLGSLYFFFTRQFRIFIVRKYLKSKFEMSCVSMMKNKTKNEKKNYKFYTEIFVTGLDDLKSKKFNFSLNINTIKYSFIKEQTFLYFLTLQFSYNFITYFCHLTFIFSQFLPFLNSKYRSQSYFTKDIFVFH